MKTKQIIGQMQKGIRQYLILIFVFISSFGLMGGCEDKKEAKEVPADSVTTEVQQASYVPLWVPARTNPLIRFYFIPEMEIYYDSYLGNYVYWNDSYWMYSSVLPFGYSYFDLFGANVVFLSVGVTHPWHHHHFYVTHYPVYFFGGDHHRNRYGWRIYNENGRRFLSPHKSAKYNVHYNIHENKNAGVKSGNNPFKQSNGGSQKENQHYYKSDNGKQQHYGTQQQGKNNEINKHQQPGNTQTGQHSGQRKTDVKMQSRTKMGQGGKGGGGKGGGKR